MALADFVRWRDWARLRARIAGAGPDEAYALISEIGWDAPLDVSLNGLVEGPEDVLGLTIAAGIHRGRAGRKRGGASADETSEAQFEGFFDELSRAVELARAAVDVSPDYGLAAAVLAGCSREFDDQGKYEVEALLKRARDVPVQGYTEILISRTEKWGGSHEEMWRVAGLFRGKAKPGSLSLVARAHWERWMYYLAFDETPGAQLKGQVYFRRPEVREELAAISDEAMAYGDVDPYHVLELDSILGRCLMDAGDVRRGRRHLKRLGRRSNPGVWGVGTTGLSEGLRLSLYRLRAGLL